MSDARSFLFPFKSSGEDHCTVKPPPCVEAPTVWVIVFDRSFASDMPKSHKQTDPFATNQDVVGFQIAVHDGNFRRVQIRDASRSFRGVSSELGNYRWAFLSRAVATSRTLLSHSSMTIQPNAGHAPNIFSTFGMVQRTQNRRLAAHLVFDVVRNDRHLSGFRSD